MCEKKWQGNVQNILGTGVGEYNFLHSPFSRYPREWQSVCSEGNKKEVKQIVKKFN